MNVAIVEHVVPKIKAVQDKNKEIKWYSVPVLESSTGLLRQVINRLTGRQEVLLGSAANCRQCN